MARALDSPNVDDASVARLEAGQPPGPRVRERLSGRLRTSEHDEGRASLTAAGRVLGSLDWTSIPRPETFAKVPVVSEPELTKVEPGHFFGSDYPRAG